MNDDGTPGQALSLEDAELLASAHLELLEAQVAGRTVLGSTAGGALVAAAHQRLGTHRVLLSLVRAGRDLVIPLSDYSAHVLVGGMTGSGKAAAMPFVTAPAASRNEVA